MTTEKGKWIVKYNPDEFEYRQVLESLTDLHDHMDQQQRNAAYKQICFDKNLNNGFSLEIAEAFRQISAVDIKPKKEDIKRILLAYPVRISDKRWETIHLTTTALFLGSTLWAAGFHVSTRKLIMPVTFMDDALTANDLVGLTLFEDLFTETKDFLDRLRATKYNGLLAAGGPMITLNPLKSARHLPELNLLVRGEAEFILPRLLRAINTNDLAALLEIKGFLFQIPGTVIISDLNHINRPEDFSGFQFHLDFLEKKHLENGLEINVSRGCSRGCLFCSHVQGRTLRKLPAETFDRLLSDFSNKIKSFNVTAPCAKSININDDDILQDIDYTETIFQLIKKHNYRLWGIQTSINSFFKTAHSINDKLLDIISDKVLYVDNNPLAWTGTDAFLEERGKKLGKWIPSETQMLTLMEAFEQREIRNYHYWISSDYHSNWAEFVREFLFIYRLHSQYKTFGLIAHSPFLVPYPTTPLYRLLIKSPELETRIKYKKVLKGGKKIFEFPLVERVETGYPYLNRLLNNESLGSRMGFFDYLKKKDYVNAFITLYNFLKQERLSFESSNNPESESLKKTEGELEAFISTII